MAMRDEMDDELEAGDDRSIGGFPYSGMSPLPEDAEPLPDGTIEVEVPGLEPQEDSEDENAEPLAFDDNLAKDLTESERTTLGFKLKELVEVDLQARAPWEARLIDGLEIIGLEDIPDDAVAFEGAARANYPGLAEAMVQFQARAMDELMPPEGPVKCGVLGKSSEEREEQAQRVQDYMNYQLTLEDDEYYSETDDLLLYLPYAGSAFRKVAIDPVTGRTRSRFVPASDFIVPYFAKSLATAPRYTHRYTMPENSYRRAVANGYFVEHDFSGLTAASATTTTSTELADASDKKAPAYHEEDRDLQFYETTIDWDFDWDRNARGEPELGYSKPYVITFEWETGAVVRVARCWKEADEKCKKDVWFTHYKFLPGLGFYGWGFLHIIGGLGRAASGAVRLLLDGSATASLQGGFKAKDARLSGDMTFSPATWVDVDMTAEELAKSFYAPPFKEPSPALFKTLEILIAAIQRFASTTENMVGDASNTGPVGTTVALIEQGSKIYSGIHKRIHNAAGKEFRLIAESNFRFMEMDEYPFEVQGAPRSIMRSDFDRRVDITPVSDPNIFSNVQRIALGQAVVQAVNERPDVFSPKAAKKAYRFLFKSLRVPDADEYLPEKDVKRLDPVSENVAMLNGHGVQAFAEQDDEAHLAVHAAFEQEVAGMDPEIQQKIIPALKAHKAAHFANAYRKRVMAVVEQQTGGIPLPPFDPNNYDDAEELPPEIEAAIARASMAYAPPPPPPMADPAEAAKDQAAGREADRKDMLAQRDADRADAKQRAELKREGLISDVEPSGGSPV